MQRGRVAARTHPDLGGSGNHLCNALALRVNASVLLLLLVFGVLVLVLVLVLLLLLLLLLLVPVLLLRFAAATLCCCCALLVSHSPSPSISPHFLHRSYLLGRLSMPLLQNTPGSRLVLVSSGGMLNSKFPAWEMAASEGVQAVKA
jgi:hypothetical protein